MSQQMPTPTVWFDSDPEGGPNTVPHTLTAAKPDTADPLLLSAFSAMCAARPAERAQAWYSELTGDRFDLSAHDAPAAVFRAMLADAKTPPAAASAAASFVLSSGGLAVLGGYTVCQGLASGLAVVTAVTS